MSKYGDFSGPYFPTFGLSTERYVTYFQADESTFFTRESFGKMLEVEFSTGASVAKVDYWACCREEHENDEFHYHCTLKLQRMAAKHSCQSKM